MNLTRRSLVASALALVTGRAFRRDQPPAVAEPTPRPRFFHGMTSGVITDGFHRFQIRVFDLALMRPEDAPQEGDCRVNDAHDGPIEFRIESLGKGDVRS